MFVHNVSLQGSSETTQRSPSKCYEMYLAEIAGFASSDRSCNGTGLADAAASGSNGNGIESEDILRTKR